MDNFESKNDRLEELFNLELKTREFNIWRDSLSDSNTINWVELLLDTIDTLQEENDDLNSELEDLSFYQTFTGVVILFLFVFFLVSMLHWFFS